MNNQEERVRREAAEKEMLPCPFCGSTNLRISVTAHHHYGYCTQCGCSGGWGSGIQGGVEKWNNRPSDAVKEQLAEALLGLLKRHAEVLYPKSGCDCEDCIAYRAIAAYREEQTP